jgi:hypothetical protein
MNYKVCDLTNFINEIIWSKPEHTLQCHSSWSRRNECETIIMGLLEGLLLKCFYFLNIIIHVTNMTQQLKLIKCSSEVLLAVVLVKYFVQVY